MLRHEIMTVLENAGAPATLDEDGDLVFRHAGLPFWIRHEEEAPDFIAVCTQVLYTVGLHAPDAVVKRIIMQANQHVKVAKAILLQREQGKCGVLLAAEQFATAESLRQCLPRYLDALMLMRQVIYDQLRACDAAAMPH